MKYIWWSGTGREQLFNLESDPTECYDLGSDIKWRSRLIHELSRRPEGFVQRGELVSGRSVSPLLPPNG